MEFLDIQHENSDPFFMMLSTPACHAPFTPAPQYQKEFSNQSAPTGGSFNKLGKVEYSITRINSIYFKEIYTSNIFIAI